MPETETGCKVLGLERVWMESAGKAAYLIPIPMESVGKEGVCKFETTVGRRMHR